MRLSPLIALLVLASPAGAGSLTLVRTIVLDYGGSKLDHSGLDAAGSRLFVSGSAIDEIRVLDLKDGRVLCSLPGQSESQGVLYVPEINRICVANGKDGSFRMYDGTTYALAASLPFSEDTDNIRYDAKAKRLYVSYASAMAVIDGPRAVQIEDIPLRAHPEAFALEKAGSKLIMNLPDAGNVTVYDRALGKITAEWPLGAVHDNFTIALDEAGRRTFIGSRHPALFLAFDTDTGREVARLPLHGDCDDFHYDSKRHRIYASCGEGFLDVFRQIDRDHYALQESIPTAPAGRTCAFDGDTLYLAVAERPGQPASIRCYRAD